MGLTTTVCRISALAVCAGAGVALAGGGPTAVFAGSLLGGVAPNFLHQVVDSFLSWFGDQKRGTTTLPANHDLDGLTASAINLVLKNARDRLPTDDPKRGVLERLANAPVPTIVAVMQAEDRRVVNETEIVATLGNPAGGQTTTVATPEYWQAFIAALMQRTAASEQPTAMNTAVRDIADILRLAARAVKDVSKDLLAKDLTARATDPGAADGAAFAAQLLHAHVASFANDVLRDTFGPQGRFFIAALFNMLNSIAAQVHKPPTGVTLTPEHEQQIKTWVKEAAGEALDLTRAIAEPTNGHELAAARAVLEQINDLQTSLSGLGEQVSGLRSDLAAFLTLQRESHTKLDVLLAKHAPKLRLPPTHAPTARADLSAPALPDPDRFKASREFLAVVGREEELAELAAWLSREDPFLWDLWTGPAGSGKTRLALQLCRDHPEWSRGFYTWTADNTPDWTLWSPQEDTLIIFDYVAEKAKEIGDAVASLCARLQPESTSPLPPGVKVRFLLLERAAVRDTDAAAPAPAAEQKLEAPWLGVFRTAAKQNGAAVESVYARGDLNHPGRYLGGVSVDAAKAIIIAEHEGAPRPAGELPVQMTDDQLKSRFQAALRIDRHLRPLFIAMTAEAVREKGGAFDALDGGTGIDALVQHINDKEWKHACERLQAFAEGPGASIDAWVRFVCLATMCGGLEDPPKGTNGRPLAGVRAVLTEALGVAASLKTPDADAYGNGARYALLVSGAHQDDAPKLEPDVLGEGFVLHWLESHKRLARPLIDAAWTLGMSDFVRRAAENFPARAEASGLLEPVEVADPAALASAHTALGTREYVKGDMEALRARGKRLLTGTHKRGQPLQPPRVRALGAFLWMHGKSTTLELDELVAALDRLPAPAYLDSATRGFLAMGLFNAYNQSPLNSDRGDELLARLRSLGDAHPQDKVVTRELATGLSNAVYHAGADHNRVHALLTRLQALVVARPDDVEVREQMATALTNAIVHARDDRFRSDGLLLRLQKLAEDYPEDATVRAQLAKGLANAISFARNNDVCAYLVDRLQAMVHARPFEAAILEPLAVGLFNAFNNAPPNSPNAHEMMVRLEQLVRDHPGEAVLCRKLAALLNNAIAQAGTNIVLTDDLLSRLEALANSHPSDKEVRELLASGLNNAIADAGKDDARVDTLLHRLQSLAHPSSMSEGIRAHLAMGLFNAFSHAAPGLSRAADFLKRIEALATLFSLDSAVGKVAWRASGVAFVRSLDPGPPQARHLHRMALLLPRLAGDNEVRQMTRRLIDGVIQMIEQVPADDPLTKELDAAVAALWQAYQATFGPDQP